VDRQFLKLTRSIGEELRALETLSELARALGAALVGNDNDELAAVVKHQEAVASQLTTMEAERSRHAAATASALGLETTATLREIGRAAGGNVEEQALSLHGALCTVVNELSELNGRNELLIRQARQGARHAISLLTHAQQTHCGSYAPQGGARGYARALVNCTA
jgi:hypothetical protein